MKDSIGRFYLGNHVHYPLSVCLWRKGDIPVHGRKVRVKVMVVGHIFLRYCLGNAKDLYLFDPRFDGRITGQGNVPRPHSANNGIAVEVRSVFEALDVAVFAYAIDVVLAVGVRYGKTGAQRVISPAQSRTIPWCAD